MARLTLLSTAELSLVEAALPAKLRGPGYALSGVAVAEANRIAQVNRLPVPGTPRARFELLASKSKADIERYGYATTASEIAAVYTDGLTAWKEKKGLKTVQSKRPVGVKLKTVNTGDLVSIDVLRPMFGEAERITGVKASVLEAFLNIEARRVGDLYDVKSVSPNGNFHGLMQMGRPAWRDASDWLTARGVLLPSFLDGRYVAQANILAAAAYAARYSDRLAALRIPLTAQTMYGIHNQGPGGFKTFMRTGRIEGDQSPKAIALLKEVRSRFA